MVLDILQVREDLQQGHPDSPAPVDPFAQRYLPNVQLAKLTWIWCQPRGWYTLGGRFERLVDEARRIEVDLELGELGAIGCERREAVYGHIHEGGGTRSTAEVEFDQIRHREGDGRYVVVGEEELTTGHVAHRRYADRLESGKILK